MPDFIIIAGPNGAGKTTFARGYLSPEFADVTLVSADESSSALTGLMRAVYSTAMTENEHGRHIEATFKRAAWKAVHGTR